MNVGEFDQTSGKFIPLKCLISREIDKGADLDESRR